MCPVILLETPDLHIYGKVFTIFLILPLYKSITLTYDDTVCTINYSEIVTLLDELLLTKFEGYMRKSLATSQVEFTKCGNGHVGTVVIKFELGMCICFCCTYILSINFSSKLKVSVLLVT